MTGQIEWETLYLMTEVEAMFAGLEKKKNLPTMNNVSIK
jgi:hypothetical protein